MCFAAHASMNQSFNPLLEIAVADEACIVAGFFLFNFQLRHINDMQWDLLCLHATRSQPVHRLFRPLGSRAGWLSGLMAGG